MSKSPLNEQQKKFIDALLGDANGSPVRAKELAGYSKTYPTKELMFTLKEHIIEATQLYIAMHAPKAAMAVISGIDDPTELGIKEKLSAAKDLLDRSGVVKTEKLEVQTSGGIMILPPKDSSE
jgi:hypothetical protein